jgi:hypothetical protein
MSVRIDAVKKRLKWEEVLIEYMKIMREPCWSVVGCRIAEKPRSGQVQWMASSTVANRSMSALSPISHACSIFGGCLSLPCVCYGGLVVALTTILTESLQCSSPASSRIGTYLP